MAFDDVRGRGFKSRADVADVLAWIDARPAPLAPEIASVAPAAGRVLGSAVRSTVDVPAFARASMDGWAVRGADTFGASDSEPLLLKVVGESRPGAPPPGPIGAGEAVRIRTGAPMPGGADAVLPYEMGEEDEDVLHVRGEVPPGRNIGAVGEDVVAGTEVLPKGRVLRPQDLGLLSAIGRTEVSVVRRPSVEILVTGEEVLPAGSSPHGFCVPDANTPMLEALVARDGGRVSSTELAGDSDARLEERMWNPGSEVLLVTGGSSVGPEDCVPALVAKHGTLAFHGIAMRPSSPAGIGVVRDTVVFLLPGNPVSCLCAYDFFAGRLIRRLAGRSPDWPYREIRLPLARKVVSELGRVDYLRVRIVDGRVEPLTSRGASVLTTTTRADGFVVVPRDIEGWPEGTTVSVRLYDA